MSDRLNDLRRQRALAQEQLAWLDREIAAEEARIAETGGQLNATARAILGAKAAAAAPTATTFPSPVVPRDAAASAALSPATYEADSVTTQQDVKRGCLLYVIGAFVALFLAFAALYFFRYRDHPLFIVPHDEPATQPTPKKP